MDNRPPRVVRDPISGRLVDQRTARVVSEHKIDRVLLQFQKSIQDSYEAIKEDHAGRDNGVAGDAHETLWASLFNEWFPQYPSVTKVAILTPDGHYTPEVDLVLLEPNYPRPLLAKKTILSSGVVAAFECKLTFYQSDLPAVLQKAAAVKRAATARIQPQDVYRYLCGRFPYGLLAASHEWKSPGSTPFENINKHLHQKIRLHAQHPNELVDLICVADVAHWATITFAYPRIERGNELFHQGGISTALGGSSAPAVAGMLLDLIQGLVRRDKIDGWFHEFVSQSTGHAGTGGGNAIPWPDTLFPQQFVKDIRDGRLSIHSKS